MHIHFCQLKNDFTHPPFYPGASSQSTLLLLLLSKVWQSTREAYLARQKYEAEVDALLSLVACQYTNDSPNACASHVSTLDLPWSLGAMIVSGEGLPRLQIRSPTSHTGERVGASCLYIPLVIYIYRGILKFYVWKWI
jgi:hypothetical protein